GHDGARDRDALLLAAGELLGAVVPACGQADGPERDLCPPAPLGARQAGQQERQLDVLDRAQHRDQVVELEDEAHVPRAPGREAVLVEPGEGLAGDHHLARIGPVEAGEQVEQGRLARPRGTHERHGRIAFPGATAFPGGGVDPGDADAPGARLPAAQRWAPPGEGDRPPEALAYWVAALRELLEETGVLLAARDGRLLEGPLAPELAALRARVAAGEPFGRVLAAAGLVPATEALFYFARWITPVTNPRRWDTRFLVGRLPAGQEPVADGTETVSCTWMSPRAALAAYEAGRIVLIPPTVRTLDDLARFPSMDAVLADAAGRVV